MAGLGVHRADSYQFPASRGQVDDRIGEPDRGDPTVMAAHVLGSGLPGSPSRCL